jgi:hypothetical protein
MSLYDRIFPTFYILEIQGKATESIFPGEFNIEKIAIASTDFNDDMTALSALSEMLSMVLQATPNVNSEDIDEKIEYNPEFYPFLDVSSENSEIPEDEENEEENIFSSDSIQVAITNNFDNIGDFVSTRWTIKSNDLTLLGKVAINPDAYLQEKVKAVQNLTPLNNKLQNKISIH